MSRIGRYLLASTRTVKRFLAQIVSRPFVIKEFKSVAVRGTLSSLLRDEKRCVKFPPTSMNSDLMHTVMTTWIAKDLPARLDALINAFLQKHWVLIRRRRQIGGKHPVFNPHST
jgi:hypothetical protein